VTSSSADSLERGDARLEGHAFPTPSLSNGGNRRTQRRRHNEKIVRVTESQPVPLKIRVVHIIRLAAQHSLILEDTPAFCAAPNGTWTRARLDTPIVWFVIQPIEACQHARLMATVIYCLDGGIDYTLCWFFSRLALLFTRSKTAADIFSRSRLARQKNSSPLYVVYPAVQAVYDNINAGKPV
jgi:hypothetical protein